MEDASAQGEPVTAKPRDAAQVPISLMPKACAGANPGNESAMNPVTAKDRVIRCRCISILRLFPPAPGQRDGLVPA